MKIQKLLLSLFLFSSVSFASGQDMTPKEPRWKQLSQAYGFICGQQASLELIGKKFPDLDKEVKQSWFAFNSSALGDSVKGVEAELSTDLGEKWPEMKEKIATQMTEMVRGQQFTREQATAFLADVKLRSKGELPESIRAVLLSAHPRYANNSGLEISEGWKQIFRTKDHPKAKGVDFSLSLPASWSKREGNRPNIIQFFQSKVGHGPIMCSIMIKTLPLPAGTVPSKDELKEFFQPNELKGMVPEGDKFIESKFIVLEGSPAGMLVSDATRQRMDFTLTTRMTQFITIQGASMIFIQFMVVKMPDLKESLDDLQKRYLPTYRAIANSFVYNDKYK
jgi:hypothetical protein